MARNPTTFTMPATVERIDATARLVNKLSLPIGCLNIYEFVLDHEGTIL